MLSRGKLQTKERERETNQFFLQVPSHHSTILLPAFVARVSGLCRQDEHHRESLLSNVSLWISLQFYMKAMTVKSVSFRIEFTRIRINIRTHSKSFGFMFGFIQISRQVKTDSFRIEICRIHFRIHVRILVQICIRFRIRIHVQIYIQILFGIQDKWNWIPSTQMSVTFKWVDCIVPALLVDVRIQDERTARAILIQICWFNFWGLKWVLHASSQKNAPLWRELGSC